MTDLIEKALRHMNDPHARYSMKDRFDHAQLFTDEIERLRVERDRATSKVLQIDREYVALEAEIERLRNALQGIVECDGNTLLGCSPEHDYVPDLYPEEEKAHQYGAYKAFSQCARIAAAALEDE